MLSVVRVQVFLLLLLSRKKFPLAALQLPTAMKSINQTCGVKERVSDTY